MDRQTISGAIDQWLDNDPDQSRRQELEALRAANEWAALAELFAGRLQFGTAGIRGIVGVGPMRMNRLVIQQTSAGLARHVLDAVANAASRGVVVTFDARPDSEQFAHDAASVFLAAGLKVFLTESAQPTPIGAYAVTALNAAAGVVVTASHNPPEYNGYKVYGDNGAQIIPPNDEAIAKCIEDAATESIEVAPLADARRDGRLKLLGAEFIADYCDHVEQALAEWRNMNHTSVKIAYTAMHGVGADLACRIVEATGTASFHSVAEQHAPNGRFPTVAFPNPEEPGAMDAVIKLAQESACDLACANDPDADRLAVAVRNSAGELTMLTGDQIGILLGNCCLEKTQASKQIVCASLVSSRLLGQIAESVGAHYFETLTGFKWLANTALENESDQRRFLFAYEEALGYALGQVVRDKDGLSALALFVQMTAELKAQGKTALDKLDEIYRHHGLYLSEQRSIKTVPGGPSITNLLRQYPSKQVAGLEVTSCKDLQQLRQTFKDGTQKKLEYHPSDVLVYYLADESRVIVRPSGTEPKTKCYYEVARSLTGAADSKTAAEDAQRALKQLVDTHQTELDALLADSA